MEELCNETAAILRAPEIDLTDSSLLPYPFEDHQGMQDFYDGNCSQFFPFNATELYDPEYYSYTYRIIGTFFQGIIFLVGLVGNILVVLVVAKTKSMHSPTNCYLVSLACADVIALVASVPNEIIFYYLIGDRWVWGDWGCAIFTFAQFLGINASALSLTAFTVERYIAICHPMKAQTMCTVNRAKKIILGVWIFSVIYCGPWLFLTKLKAIPYKGFEDVMKCSFKLGRETYVYIFLVDLIAFYVFPLLLSMILYGLIARILFASRSIKASVGGAKNGQLTVSVDSTKTNAARTQVVKMLVMVVVIFAVLWLPYRGMVVYNSFAAMFGKETFMDLWFLMLAKTCVYINSAINPILYNAMSVKFRRAFGRTLSCGKQTNESAYWGYTTRATTYTCASSGLPSSATLNYNTNLNARGPSPGLESMSSSTSSKRLKSGLIQSASPKGVHIPLRRKPPGTTFTSIDILVDSSDKIRPCRIEGDETDQLVDQEEITQL